MLAPPRLILGKPDAADIFLLTASVGIEKLEERDDVDRVSVFSDELTPLIADDAVELKSPNEIAI